MVHFRRASTQTVNDVERDECLERARQYVAGGGQRNVQLHGYASEEGDVAYNDRLARQRADRVKALFVRKGVPEAIVAPSGHGEDVTFPTREGNRRVEVVLVENINFDPETIVSHRYKCGPDVTEKIERAT